LALLWFGPVAALRRDNFRSDIRRVRDELFDFMWKNGLSYETKAYRDARQFLNGTLRMSDHLTAAMFLLGAFYLKWYEIETDDGRPSFDNCPKVLRDKLQSVYEAAVRRMLKYMFTEGTLGLLLRVVVLACRGSHRWMQATNRLVGEVYALGAPPEQLTVLQRRLLGC
jgi:hypothetical protein